MKKVFTTAWLILIVIVQPSLAQTVTKSAKVGNSIYELVYNNKDNSVYVATTRGNAEKPTIYQLSADDLSVKDSIVLQTAAFGLGINQVTQTLYGTATRGGGVVPVDLKNKKELPLISNGTEESHTREVVVDEANNKIYVSDVRGGVWVIDGKTNTFSHMLKGIAGATGLAINPKVERLYAISKNKVIFYALRADVIIDSFTTGGEGAINLVLDTKRNHLFVSHQGSGTVTVLDAENGSLLKTIPAGDGALGITYSPEKDRVFVANRGAGSVTIINAADYSVADNVVSGSLPNTVVTDDKGNAYISNKAKGGGRPKPGEKPQPSNDPDGDMVIKISL